MTTIYHISQHLPLLTKIYIKITIVLQKNLIDNILDILYLTTTFFSLPGHPEVGVLHYHKHTNKQVVIATLRLTGIGADSVKIYKACANYVLRLFLQTQYTARSNISWKGRSNDNNFKPKKVWPTTPVNF